jgi:hypothetical protein
MTSPDGILEGMTEPACDIGGRKATCKQQQQQEAVSTVRTAQNTRLERRDLRCLLP